MNDRGIEVSLFITPDPAQIEAAARTGSQFIELHTGAFADGFGRSRRRDAELRRLVAGAEQAHELGLRVNAGHGLNYQNLPLLRCVPHLVELNIGHSIISRAVTIGLALGAAVGGQPLLDKSPEGFGDFDRILRSDEP
jgi:pyridoxine 5-phosphate synthase